MEELPQIIKNLEKRVSVLEAILKIQPSYYTAVNPIKKEDLDDRMQCWGCGEYCDEGVVHKCDGR